MTNFRFANFAFRLAAAMILGFAGCTSVAFAGDPALRIAIGDNPASEYANLLIAIERARARGVDITVSYLGSENFAMAAVRSNLADIGVGTPYQEIQKSDLPIRIFFQLSRLRFFPVVNKHYYNSWADLDGAEIYSHSRGSGTEAVMNYMAAMHGIEYAAMRYLPGSSVRADAMQNGRIKATIVDSRRRQLLLDDEEGRFSTLPMTGFDVTDEALYATLVTIEKKMPAIVILVEELLNTWREINTAPGKVDALVRKAGLDRILSPAEIDDIAPYFREAVSDRSFPDNGGSREDVQNDLRFYASSGTITRDLRSERVDVFWNFVPLEKALDKLGPYSSLAQ